MKVFYVFWWDCIRRKHLVIINAKDAKERDKIFSEWRKENPNIAPSAYSPREITLEEGECFYINSVTHD